MQLSADLQWVAEYADGSTCSGETTPYKELKREGLIAFALFSKQGEPVAVMQLSADRTVFYRSRVFMKLSGESARIHDWLQKQTGAASLNCS